MGLTGGLFDNQDPKTLGLLGLAQGLLQASGPSRTPVSFGQALGGGLQGMQQAREEALKNQYMQAQIKKSSMEKISPGESIYDVNTGKPVISSNIFGGLPGAAGANGGGVPQGAPQVSGDEFLKTLPPSAASQVKAIAEGKMPFPSGFALKTPYWQQMISAVSQYDPSFDAVNYNSRAKTRSSFTSGADANNIAAINTAIPHIVKLKEAFNNLGNTDYPMVNTAKNYLGNALGFTNIQKNTAAVKTDAIAVAHELAKVFRNSGMSEGEINDWQKQIADNAAPASSDQVIQSALDLMDGRLQAVGDKYNQGMGTSKHPLELLSPSSQKAYQALRGLQSPTGQSPQQNSQPKAGTPRPVTMDEVNATAQKYGISPQKVAQDLQAKGYTIQSAQQQPQMPQAGGVSGGW